MNIIPINSKPTILFHRDSHIEMAIIRLESTVSSMLNLQNSLILSTLLDIDPFLDFLHDVTCTHTSPAFIFETPSRTSLASHLFSPYSIVYFCLAATRKTRRKGFTHTLRTRLIPREG